MINPHLILGPAFGILPYLVPNAENLKKKLSFFRKCLLFFQLSHGIMFWLKIDPYPNAKGANDVKRLKTLLALVACIVLFAGTVLFTLVFSPEAVGDSQSGSPILLSEIMAGNRTYPAPNGQFLDYIEVYNAS